MTQNQRKALDWLLITALAALMGAGSGVVSGYQGAARHDQQQDDALARIEAKVDRVDERVSEMYCAGKPPGCR